MFRFATCNEFIRLKAAHPDCWMKPSMLWTLKQFDILFTADMLRKVPSGRVLEVGGGLERYFDEKFGAELDYWMVDAPHHFYSVEAFNDAHALRKHTTFVDALMGEFDKRLPDNHFDVVFSVGSVLNSTPPAQRSAAIEDMFRVLKPGGYMIHFVHLHLDEKLTLANLLLRDLNAAGFVHVEEPTLRWSSFGDPILLETLEMVYEGYVTRGAEDRWTNLRDVKFLYGDLISVQYKPI